MQVNKKESLIWFRAYVAVAGGISVPPVMGSRSTNLPSGFGGFQGRKLEKNDIQASENHSQHVKTDTRTFNAAWIPVYPNNRSLRVIRGPQEDHLLGQIKPEDAVRFEAVFLDEAPRPLTAVEGKVHKFEARLK